MTSEIIQLQDSVRRVLDGAGLAAAENVIWPQVIELGWLLVSVPEALSGLDAGIQGASAIHYENGRALSSAPYLPAMLAVDAVCQSTLAERDAWLEHQIGGELVTAPLANCAISVAGAQLSGFVQGVPSADEASHVLVWTAGNEALVLVDLKQSGVEVVFRQTWDTTRRLFDVRLTGIEISAQTILAEGAAAGSLIQRLQSLRDFALAADAIGSASALLDLTVEHLRTRVQFKRPLAMFQALKHRCADMKTAIVAADALLQDALVQVENQLDSSVARTKSMEAKLLATSTFARVAEDCLQLHGGIGMADEHPCHLFLKRALLGEQLSGSSNAYAVEIAKRTLAL